MIFDAFDFNPLVPAAAVCRLAAVYLQPILDAAGRLIALDTKQSKPIAKHFVASLS